MKGLSDDSLRKAAREIEDGLGRAAHQDGAGRFNHRDRGKSVMSRILKNVHSSAKRLHDAGYLTDLTMREFDALCLSPCPEFTPRHVQHIREKARVSQGVFAAFLNVGKTTVAAWEQGTKKPSGAAAKLLELVERKGLEVLA
jgi:putative transcriptional regulator